MNSLDRDRALIEKLGGPAKLAETLGYEKDGGVQRVQNWLTRGIPAAVKLDHPELFLRDLNVPDKPDLEGKRASASAKRRPPARQLREPRQDKQRDKPSNRKGRTGPS